MSNKPTDARGTASFWYQPVPESEKNPEAAGPIIDDEAPNNTLRFEGVTMAIVVETLPRKDRKAPTIEDGQLVLGNLLVKILKDPKFVRALQNKYVFTTKPPESSVQLDFGSVTLYAAASSSNLDLAIARGLDRLALALMMASPRDLESFLVSVRRKT